METDILYSLLQIFFLIRMNNTPQGDGNWASSVLK